MYNGLAPLIAFKQMLDRGTSCLGDVHEHHLVEDGRHLWIRMALVRSGCGSVAVGSSHGPCEEIVGHRRIAYYRNYGTRVLYGIARVVVNEASMRMWLGVIKVRREVGENVACPTTLC